MGSRISSFLADADLASPQGNGALAERASGSALEWADHSDRLSLGDAHAAFRGNRLSILPRLAHAFASTGIDRDHGLQALPGLVKRMWYLFACFLSLALWAGMVFPIPARAERVKDLVDIAGVRNNQLIGYGLAVGLEGTGDSFFRSNFTQQSLANFLKKLGILLDERTIRGLRLRNSAAVMVVATLPPFARQGSRIDAIVSSVGDAGGLQGGTLLMTPLKGPDGRVYAVAQGPVSVGGFRPGKVPVRGERNYSTTGRISGGAIIEKEVIVDLEQKEQLTLVLINPDFTTSSRIAQAVNAGLGGDVAKPIDATAVAVNIPDDFRGNVVDMVTAIEALEVDEGVRARIVLDERTGTVVMGENLRLKSVAISHGDLHIAIKEEPEPLPLSPNESIIVPQDMSEDGSRKEQVLLLPPGPTLGEIVKALNTVGVTPRDLIAILNTLRAAGALNAQIDLM